MITAHIKHATHLEHYGEFTTFDEADKHLASEGWELERVIYNGVSWKWIYEKGFQVMVVKEAVDSYAGWEK